MRAHACRDSAPREVVADPGEAPDVDLYLLRSRRGRRGGTTTTSPQRDFPAEVMPVANTDIGPGSLSLFMGGEADLSEETVWYMP